MNVYEIDTLVKVASSFTEVTGSAVDPTTVTLYIRDPSGALATVPMGALSHDAVGVFSYPINASVSGVWTYKFQGAGNVETTSPDTTFLVQSSRLIAG
ncbi:MAG TPA: hypothetical protein VKQ70_02485 [Caulobacteraceae bacterium]|jgi:hypothetical protein|nr:hypothetical protein [Caulobacteraceae bacterium]